VLLGCLPSACRSSKEVPEQGAVLLRLGLAAETPAPDELRVFVYDEQAALWQDARIPAQGALPPPQGTALGTFLIQPGEVEGALRIDVRGLAGGAEVAEGVLSLAAAERGTFDLLLHAGALSDRDGDGVPDTLDDCADRPNPNQGGCPAADAGGSDGGPGLEDASVDERQVDDAGADVAPPRDAGQDAVVDAKPPATDAGADAGATCAFPGGCGLALGASCTNAAQCASASCVDGVCCNGSCNGTCRACNVAGHLGTCTAQPSGADPEKECRTGFSCNGNGGCSLDLTGILRANGAACALAAECGSAFCKDGVCCNSACNGPCQTCVGGMCKSVTKGDDVPECPAPAQCNAAGRCLGR